MTTRVAADPAKLSKYSQFKTTNYGVPRGRSLTVQRDARVRLNRFEESSFAPAIQGIPPNFMVLNVFFPSGKGVKYGSEQLLARQQNSN